MKKLIALWATLFIVLWPALAHAQDVPEKLESVLTQSAERPFLVVAGLLFAWCMTQVFKSDIWFFSRLPVPKPFRPLLAIVFAQLFHMIEAISLGIRWDVALTRGFVAGASAIGMHDNGASVLAALEWIRTKAAGGAATGVLLIVALAGVSSSGCGASPRGILVDGTTYASDVADREGPVVEKACVVELPKLKDPEWSERSKDCDLATPANDVLATIIVEAKALLKKPKVTAADLLAMAGKVATAAGDLIAAIAALKPDGAK